MCAVFALVSRLRRKIYYIREITRFTNKYYKYDVDFDFFVGLLSRREFNFSETNRVTITEVTIRLQ